MLFKDIPGLNEVKKQFIAAVDGNHLAHALLISGGEGSGNLALALALATYVNCTNRTGGDSCGECPSCHKNKKFIHPDLHFVFPVCSTKEVKGSDAVSASFLKEWRNYLAANPYGGGDDWSGFFGGDNKQLNISKEESRHIIRNLSLKTFEGQYKIMLVWLPEYMHPFAANAILKILEEPPPQTLFLLVTQSPGDLLSTIISRTQPLHVRWFNDEEIKDVLASRFQAGETKAVQIAQLANGNLNEAVKLLQEVEEDAHALFRDWMRFCFMYDVAQLIGTSEKFQKMNKLGQRTMLQYGLDIMRETLLRHAAGDALSRLNGEGKAFVEKFSKAINPDMIELISGQINDALYHLERNANAKIVFLDLSLTIAGIMKK